MPSRNFVDINSIVEKIAERKLHELAKTDEYSHLITADTDDWKKAVSELSTTIMKNIDALKEENKHQLELTAAKAKGVAGYLDSTKAEADRLKALEEEKRVQLEVAKANGATTEELKELTAQLDEAKEATNAAVKETDDAKTKILKNGTALGKLQLKEYEKQEKAQRHEELQHKKDIGEELTEEEKKEYNDTKPDFIKSLSDGVSKAMSGSMGDLAQGLVKMGDKIVAAMDNAIDQAMDTNVKYQAKIDTRLQQLADGDKVGFYDTLSSSVTSAFALSPWAKQTEMIENINKVVEAGIGRNIEQRAYLLTFADRISTTFNAIDDNLNRLVRLQQNDLSVAEMGMSSYLTQYLNSYFQDTSYLNNTYANTRNGLMDTLSQLSATDTTGFEFAVQKWLSALYSVGMSEEAISTIVKGINLLGSGNVSSLTGDEPLTTLFGLAAAKSGISLSDMLVQGLNASNVNTLMNSMVEYLRDIANNTNNQVTKSEWSRITNLSISDLRAVQNLTDADIRLISNSNIDYQRAVEETYNQMQLIPERTPMGQRIDNLTSNFMFALGKQIADNDVSYVAWEVTSALKDVLSMFGSFGEGIATFITGLQLAGTLVGGLFMIPDMIKSIESEGGLTGFDWIDATKRGGYFEGVTGVDSKTGTAQGLSSSGVLSNTENYQAEFNTLYQNQKSISNKATSITSAEIEEIDYAKLLYEAAYGENQKTMKVDITSIGGESASIFNTNSGDAFEQTIMQISAARA